MDFTARVLFVILCLLGAILFQQYRNISQPISAPYFDLEEYWGPGSKSQYKENTKIIDNRIFYPDNVIDDLKNQLNRTINLPEPLENIGFEYGFNSKKLHEIIKYWKDDYLPRWRERELFLWSYPHLTTQIQGLQIHFLHIKADNKNNKKKVYPVILLHGWPSTVREFYEFIPKFIADSEKNDYVFDIVVPSLPGYGWSQGASKPGLGPAQIGVIFRNLMLRLGYEKFFVQGGDWGAVIGSSMATLFPNNVIGFHSEMCFIQTPLSILKELYMNLNPFTSYTEKQYEDFYIPLTEKFELILTESGYFHIQATKPDTIGITLSNNPIGLAAYILEKFSTWTNPQYRHLKDGGLTGKDITLDAMLDNIMIYYLTNSITTSQRLYSEAFAKKYMSLNLDRVLVEVPTGCAHFKNEILHTHDWVLRDKFVNLIHSTHYIDGGHFPAMQLPDILYNDFIEFVNKVLDTKKVNK